MKRSQIKNVISSFLYENGVEPEDADVKADELLKELEELGMNPPTIVTFPTHYNRQEGSYGFEVNQWDEE